MAQPLTTQRSALTMMGLVDDASAFVRRLTDLLEIRSARIGVRGFRQDELDEPQDHGEMVAQCVHGRGVEAGPVGSLVHRGIIALFRGPEPEIRYISYSERRAHSH